MKNFIISIFSLPILISAQSSTATKANKHYNNYSYTKVIEKLEGKKDISTNSLRELAESYRMVGNFVKSEETFALLMNAADKTPPDILAYANVLKINGKYKEAFQQFETYSTVQSNDSRVKLLNKNKNYVEELLKDKGQFKIKNLQLNSNEQDFGTAYFKDMVVFTSSKHAKGAARRKWNGNNLNFLDVYVGKIDSAGEIVQAKLLNDVNKKYHEGPATYNKNGTIALFTVDNYKSVSSDGVRKLELYESRFEDNKWSKLSPFPLNNKEYSLGHPALNDEGNILYFSSDMPGGFGGTDIYRITRDNAGMWGAPENLGNIINTEGNEMFPFIHEDGLFFFASDGHPGLGGLDVFVTQLSNGKFAPTQNLGMPINSSHDDFSFIMNRQKTSGYFSSNRGGGKGNDDIYSYHILKPFLFGKQIKGTAKDKDGNVLANTRIELLDENNQPKFVVITKEDGSYVFDVEESKTYYLTGTKEKYFDGKNTVNTNDNNNILIVDLILEKDPGFSLMAKITDYKTGASLDNVKIKITDENGNKTEFVTPADGIYLSPITGKKLNDNLFYKIELSKQGYVSKTLEFRKKLEKPGIVDLTESLDLSLGKIELGTDVGKLVSINPIYFDVNKSNIRPDAAIELDKIVKIMNEYPVMVLELGSHTDCRSPKAYNLSLSDKRAKASAAYIVSKGIKKDRIYGKGYGESKLKNKCACEGPQPSPCTEEEHQQNRRTEFIIVKLNN